MLYIKNVSPNIRQALEEKYDIHIHLKENVEMSTYYLLLTDVPKYLLQTIEKTLKDELDRKLIKNYSTEYLPGLSYVFNEKNVFKHEVAKIAGIYLTLNTNLLLDLIKFI